MSVSSIHLKKILENLLMIWLLYSSKVGKWNNKDHGYLEVNDMEVFDLPCCQRKIKIEENWAKVTHCFFCGFPYKDK